MGKLHHIRWGSKLGMTIQFSERIAETAVTRRMSVFPRIPPNEADGQIQEGQ
jgi:hypothetical protein